MIPKFNPKEMAQQINPNTGQRRKLRKVTTDIMYNLGHYMFRQRLLQKAQQMGVHVYMVSEKYSSKACSRCGMINNMLRLSDRTFHCINPNCEFPFDRDQKASYCIFMMNVENCIGKLQFPSMLLSDSMDTENSALFV